MKLIKVSGNSTQFENVFNSEIKVEPYSKIALISASIRLNGEVILIDNQNQLLKVKTRATKPSVDAIITPGNYNISAFVSEINRTLNAALTVEPGTTDLIDPNFQWNITSDSSNKIVFQFVRGKYNLDFTTTNLINMTNAVAGTVVNASDGLDWNSYCFTTDYFINGSGETSIKIDNAGIEFAIGLIKEIPQNQPLLKPEDFDYCIFLDGDNKYKTSNLANVYESAFPPHVGDIVSIKLYDGYLWFYQDNNEIYKYEWDYTTSYHIAISIKTQNAQLTFVEWTPDPFQKVVGDTLQYHHTLSDTYDTIGDLSVGLGANNPVATKVSVSFSNNQIRDIFGFNTDVQFQTGISGRIMASRSLPDSNTPNSILIEMNNIPSLESYDGREGKKRPICAVIPSFELNQNLEIAYSAPYPIFIDINNTFEFMFNRAMIRVLSLSETETVPDIREASFIFMVGV